ncbi:hypothetical protein [Caulobacter sp. DWR1-3-2b1]|uniref:hypothetical protein n=1 Tax=Caulobacter sp. DWR1-3-2b1 TaxID=2804670 RepID=UPI003CF835FA
MAGSAIQPRRAIAGSAVEHGYNIVTTEVTPGKSGLELRQCPGVQALMAEVLFRPTSHSTTGLPDGQQSSSAAGTRSARKSRVNKIGLAARLRGEQWGGGRVLIWRVCGQDPHAGCLDLNLVVKLHFCKANRLHPTRPNDLSTLRIPFGLY